jgi:hypothetical protein
LKLQCSASSNFKIQVKPPSLAIGNLVNLLGETHAFCSPSQNDGQLQKHLFTQKTTQALSHLGDMMIGADALQRPHLVKEKAT